MDVSPNSPGLSVAASRRYWLGLGLLGLVARLILASVSTGTNDVRTWCRFGRALSEDGFINLYNSDPLFNHPPLAGLMVEWLYRLSQATILPFPFLLKLPAILADCASAWLLYQIWLARRDPPSADFSVFLFGWSLISILVSGYHGNTDPIYACLTLLSAYFVQEKRFFLGAGLALALAFNVKIIPALLVLPLLSLARNRREFIQALTGISLGILPFAWGALFVGTKFIHNIFAYGSFLDFWGLPSILLLAAAANPQQEATFKALIDYYQFYSRYLVIALTILISLLGAYRNKYTAYELFSLVLAVFFVLAPGLGIQYLCILPPLLFAFSRSWGVAISFSAGLAALHSYLHFMVSWYPLESEHHGQAPPLGIMINTIAWTLLVGILIDLGRRRKAVPREFTAR